ncbi:alpha/beta fold hydrolase [Alkalihalobacillus sp. AL-G]|uniref:alpha/beta fold hydrolase n=1 Tax=Alkalihalobacillus sp. AL-G TaxID=2926399 RepID=UPI00272BECB9|nr:alpha/beta hydrolase [Alkalihalobacillus sp. AL-G]WLD93204.1 alpha/beta hydrolase [Alkalihalobacillus sp. AL-G]
MDLTFVSVHNRKVSYKDSGQGLPLVFLHPPGMGQAVFHKQFELSKNYRIITYDMCGHGESESCQQSPTMEALAAELKDLLDALNIQRAVLIGYSAGGSVVQHFALSYPERTLGIVLSGGYPRVKSFLLNLEYQGGLLLSKSAPLQLAMIIATAHAQSKAEREHLIQSMLQTDQSVWHEFYRTSYTYSCLDRLQEIDAPMLVVYGQFARHTRAHASDYQLHVRNCSIAVVRHAFHELPTRHWKELNHLIDSFINSKVLRDNP